MAGIIKVFVSQPMRNRSEDDILKERDTILERAKTEIGGDVREIPSYFGNEINADPLKNLGRSIMLIADADIVAFAEGWRAYRGCCVEHMCAESYGKRVLEL